MIPLRNSIKPHLKVDFSKLLSYFHSSYQRYNKQTQIKAENDHLDGQKCNNELFMKSKSNSNQIFCGRNKFITKNTNKCVRFQFSQVKQQQNTQNKHSSHLSTILSQPKQHQFILNLFHSFLKQSQDTNYNFQTNPQYIISQSFTQILSSLNTLSQNINLFLLQLQIQQMSQIDRWKWGGEEWSGKLKQHRQNILIQIEERKLFYKRLQNFLSNVIKQLQGIFHSQISKINKQNLQLKNNSNLVQGDFFKHSFLTENYQEIYDQVNKSKQDYLLRSRKLKSFSLLKVNDYESNYALKLRFMIQVLSQIKHIYQIFLINQSKRLPPGQINSKFYSLNRFLSQTIISPNQYEELIKAYFNQFSEQSIKNYMFMSVGYHSPEISQLSKELIDVKLRQTIFDFDIENICSLYLIKQNQWLYNLQDSNNQQQQLSSQIYVKDRSKQKLQQNYKPNKRQYNFLNNKQILLKYAKVVIKQLQKIKNQQISQLSIQKDSLIDQNLTSNSNPQIKNYPQQQISFNKLLPHTFFNITDLIGLQSLIKQEIIPLIPNPHNAYQNLIKKKSNDFKKTTNLNKKTLIESEYFQNLQKIIKDLDQNMYFLSRFNQWNIHLIILIKNFITFLYQSEKQNILKEVKILLSEEKNSVKTQKPYLMIFFRMINILYNLRTHVNPIYIEDFIDTIEFLEKNFNQTIKKDLCLSLSISPVQLFGVFDQILIKIIKEQQNPSNKISASVLRFRILATFLDNRLIDYSQFFKLLIDTEVMYSFSSKGKDLKSNPILYFLLHSDGLQKCLNIYSKFHSNDKDQFFKLLQDSPQFQQFSSMILSYQKNFNQVLKILEQFQEISELKISQENQSKLQNKEKIKKKDSLPQILQFYEQNDLLHRYQMTDQEVYIDWLDKIFLNKQSLKKDVNRINQQNNFTSLKELQSPLKILRILSENKSFLSFSMNLTYFGYLKYLIRQMHAFQKFQSSWNYPFVADIAIGKTRIRGTQAVDQKLYILTLATSGIQGRGRFFKEQTSLNKNFMNFIDLSKGKDDSKFTQVQTFKHFYGLRNKDFSIIQLRITIDKGQQLINTVKQWLQDKLGIVQKTKNNRFDSQMFK